MRLEIHQAVHSRQGTQSYFTSHTLGAPETLANRPEDPVDTPEEPVDTHEKPLNTLEEPVDAPERSEDTSKEFVSTDMESVDSRTQSSLHTKRAAWKQRSFLGSVIYSNTRTKSHTHRVSGEKKVLVHEEERKTSRALQVIPAPWVWSKAYQISQMTSLGLSDTKLSTRNVVPTDSPCFELAKHGDRAGLNELFDMRKASPYDMDVNGRSLLHVSSELSCLAYICCSYTVS